MTSPATFDPRGAILPYADGTISTDPDRVWTVRAGPRRRCPGCQQLGQRSRVTATSSTTTLLGVHAFWDEDGCRHRHDPNRTTTTFTCSQGHDWAETERPRCWCGEGRSERPGQGQPG